jgi:hypothetical protein
LKERILSINISPCLRALAHRLPGLEDKDKRLYHRNMKIISPNYLAGGLADLCEAIRGKLKRQYSKPSSEFWLLVHSTDIVPLQPADAQVTNAEQLLSSRAHPFNKVWYLFSYSNKDYGHVLLIWPRPEGGERCGVA